MPQKAIIKEQNKLIQLWQLTDGQIRELEDKKALGEVTLICTDPNCKGEMHIRAVDSWIQTHLAHNRGELTKTCINSHAPEGARHKLSKKKIAKFLQEKYPDAQVEVEWVIDSTVYAKRRKIDVVAFLPDGTKEAHESQRGNQSSAKFRHRTHDIRNAGFDRVVWWLSGRADRMNYREWCVENCEYYGLIEFEYQEIMGQKTLVDAHLQYIKSSWQKNKWVEEREARALRQRRWLEKQRQQYQPAGKIIATPYQSPVERRVLGHQRPELRPTASDHQPIVEHFTADKPKPKVSTIKNWYQSSMVAKMLNEHYEKKLRDDIERTKQLARARWENRLDVE